MRNGTNRLAGSTSPYLLQHQHNPVDWYPWSQEALDKAKQEDKPIFLSIGYSACHWCHVMERESFENQEIADLLNRHFVAIKVDREQRPDLDQIYMQAVQMMTGSGGWPMSVFLTPSMAPFHGGTYWPPEPRWGRPGFGQVLQAIAEAWQSKREAIEAQSVELTEHLQTTAEKGQDRTGAAVEPTILQRADEYLAGAFEPKYGGFGEAPKFPHTMDLELLLRLEARDPHPNRRHIIVRSLDGMASGGIYDHLGGGFSRYSVDDRWLVPHFEKMLYDNALLVGVYLDAYLLTKDAKYREVVEGTVEYLLRDMRSPQGGFFSAEDADSEGEEGKFYVWTVDEIFSLLGDARGARFCQVYDVSRFGNFEGKNILHRIEKGERNERDRVQQVALQSGMERELLLQELKEDRSRLLKARADRIRPGLDDKVLVAWNGLLIGSLARAGCALGRADFVEAAKGAASFLLANLRREDGRWLHVWREGKAEIAGFLDDYAYLANGWFDLGIATGEVVWIDEAIQLVEKMVELFADEDGGFFYTAKDAEALVARPKDVIDHSIPSSSGMAATILAKMGLLLSREDWLKLANDTLASTATLLRKSPGAVGQLLIATDWLLGPSRQAIVRTNQPEEASQLRQRMSLSYNPRLLPLVLDEGAIERAPYPWLKRIYEEKKAIDKAEATLYLCENQTCQPPVAGVESIIRSIDGT